MSIDVGFQLLTPKAVPFTYTREDDACMDCTYTNEPILLMSMQTKIIPLDVALEIPIGYEGLIRGRSGLASKGLLVHLGTIDYTYRGNVSVIMTNLHKYDDFSICPGMRIAQFTIKPVIKINLIARESLTGTYRDTNGFGSSGL